VNIPVEHTSPRYTDRAFPSYRFVPGQSPHPTRDTDGHSYNNPLEQLSPFEARDWQSCETYLYGIDLFNYGYWWESHEALEPVWVAAGKQTETGFFIQGLIQVAIAHLKYFQGSTDVAKRMAISGLEKMGRKKGIFLGIDVDLFRSDIKSYFSNDNQLPVQIKLLIDKKGGNTSGIPGVTHILSRLKSLITRQ
jgi:hypothetical protein